MNRQLVTLPVFKFVICVLEVYDFDDGLKTFDFMSHDCLTLVVGSFYGDIAIVDRHTPG